MTTSNPMITALQRLSGRDVLINAETADEFVAGIARLATVDNMQAAQLEVASREQLCMVYGIDDRPEGDGRKPFVYQDGTAVIPVHGVLINRFGGSWGFVTGYNFIRRQLNAVLDDEDVDNFVFDVNTPGGEASGCFELAREIMASRRVKPSLAMVDSLMASGGMAIGGAATRVAAIPSARIGSIGVYRQHISIEGALKEAGVKVTFAQAGDHKTDGTPFRDLPDSVFRDWTQDVGKTHDDFIALVAEARDMAPEAVRDTQARVYRADEALAKGLINTVKTTAEAVPAFIAEMGGATPDDDEEDDEMTDTKGKGTEVTSAVDYDKIAGMIGTAVSTAMASQNRMTAIKDHGKAKGQVALATRLAANDAITEADAISMIDDAAASAKPGRSTKVKAKGKSARIADPTDEDGEDEDEDEDEDGEDGEDEADQARQNRRKERIAADETNHLENAMGRNRREKVGGGESGGDSLSGDAKATDSLLGDYALASGTDLRKKA